MAIKFPKMHIADSVVNRIMNAANEIDIQTPISYVPDPIVPDPTIEGAQLDLKLEQPVPAVAPNDDVISAITEGESSLTGLIDSG